MDAKLERCNFGFVMMDAKLERCKFGFFMMDAKLERCKFGFENLLTSTRGHFNQSWIKWPRPTRAKKLGFARLDAITIEDIGRNKWAMNSFSIE